MIRIIHFERAYHKVIKPGHYDPAKHLPGTSDAGWLS